MYDISSTISLICAHEDDLKSQEDGEYATYL